MFPAEWQMIPALSVSTWLPRFLVEQGLCSQKTQVWNGNERREGTMKNTVDLGSQV